jgi:hypothetical protein
MPCSVCRREVMGPFPPAPEWLAPWRDHSVRACTIVCLSIIADRKNPVVDPTENEQAALEAASDQAGEYLESVGETDLAKLSREQWMTLLEVAVTAWTDRLRELETDGGRAA